MSAGDLTGYMLASAARNNLEDIWLYSAPYWLVEQPDRYTGVPGCGSSQCAALTIRDQLL
jgi:hypothetical protein